MADTDECECGHVRDEHVSSKECTVTGCDCILFDAQDVQWEWPDAD